MNAGIAVLSMESAADDETEPSVPQQTLHITTRVADIRLTAVLADTEQAESSDEEVVEALSLCGPQDICNNHHFTLYFMFERL